SLLACLLQIFYFSPISPDPLELPPASTTLDFPWNNHLQKVIKLGEGILTKPEDVCIDEEGALYTATRDGWIKKMHTNGSWEDWNMIATDSLLGLTISSTPGHLLVCDAINGLLEVEKDRITVLASEVNGSKISFADDVIQASDGNVYFSDASTKFGFHDWYLDMLEAKPHGRLLMYNPSTKETSILLDNLYFANGVALSKNQDFLVVCETWKFRCLKYFLKGDDKGKTEIFVENLPGGPDNIKLAPDGSFWIALLELRLNGLNFVHKSKAAKHFLVAFPKLMELTKGVNKRAMVVNVGSDGNIINKLDDSDGKVMSCVTSVLEHDGHIYLGSLNTDFIGKLQLNN
ncbi:hypothetical protein AQUCO_07600059v1, partial [Aquilegia coerulea]